MIARATIVLLLVLNLGVAAWWLLHAPPAVEAPAVPMAAPRLQLLVETPAAPARSPATSPAVSQCAGPDDGAGGWRVYLPRLPTPDAAQAMAARIGAAGFGDYLVMPEGEDGNSIALGRYGSRDAAQRRVAALQAAGFPARCARIPASTPA